MSTDKFTFKLGIPIPLDAIEEALNREDERKASESRNNVIVTTTTGNPNGIRVHTMMPATTYEKYDEKYGVKMSAISNENSVQVINMSYTEVDCKPTKNSKFVLPPKQNRNYRVIYFDERRQAHHPDKFRTTPRFVTIAYEHDPKTNTVKYGAAIFKQQSPTEKWSRDGHDETSVKRYNKSNRRIELKTTNGNIQDMRQELRKLVYIYGVCPMN